MMAILPVRHLPSSWYGSSKILLSSLPFHSFPFVCLLLDHQTEGNEECQVLIPIERTHVASLYTVHVSRDVLS